MFVLISCNLYVGPEAFDLNILTLRKGGLVDFLSVYFLKCVRSQMQIRIGKKSPKDAVLKI